VDLSPIDCQQVLKEIELYLDGELEGPEHVEIHRHLEMCGPCMDHSEFKRHVKELLKASCGCDEVPPALLARIAEILGEPSGS
jgi:mycothiol system anti-sigma-R factor